MMDTRTRSILPYENTVEDGVMIRMRQSASEVPGLQDALQNWPDHTDGYFQANVKK